MAIKEINRTFEVEYTDSKGEKHKCKCTIKKPTMEQLEEAKAIYNRAWKKAVRDGAILAVKLPDFIKEHDLWDEKKDAEVAELRKNIHNAETKLAKGGFSLKEARNIAIEMRKWRFELRELLTLETELENKTAEAQAEEERHNYLLVATTVYSDSDEPVWKDESEYLNPTIPEVAVVASIKYATLRFGVDDSFEEKLPENAFLKQYGFVNKDLRLIRKEDGKLIDTEGNLINESGDRINEEGQLVDDEGNLLNEDGRIVVEEPLPFLDDDGQPVEVPSEPESEEKTDETVDEESTSE